MSAFSVFISKNVYGPQINPIMVMASYYTVNMPTCLEKVRSGNTVISSILINQGNVIFLNEPGHLCAEKAPKFGEPCTGNVGTLRLSLRQKEEPF